MNFLNENSWVDTRYLPELDTSLIENYVNIHASHLLHRGFMCCYLCETDLVINFLVESIIEGHSARDIVYIDSIIPMYRSVVGLYSGIVKLDVINTILVYRGGYFNEVAKLERKIYKNKSMFIFSIPSIYGAIPCNIYNIVSKKARVDYTLLIDTSSPLLFRDSTDYLVVRLRAYLPYNDITDVIVCSNKPLDILIEYGICRSIKPRYSIDTVHKCLRRICRERDKRLIKLYKLAVKHGLKPVEPMPCSNIFVFYSKKYLEPIEGLLYRVYSRHSGLYGVIVSGLENKQYIRDIEKVMEAGILLPQG